MNVCDDKKLVEVIVRNTLLEVISCTFAFHHAYINRLIHKSRDYQSSSITWTGNVVLLDFVKDTED